MYLADSNEILHISRSWRVLWMYLADSNEILHISRSWRVQNSVVVGRARLQTVDGKYDPGRSHVNKWRKFQHRAGNRDIAAWCSHSPWMIPVTSPRTVLTYPDRRPLSLLKPKCNRFNYRERPSLSWFGHRHQSAIFTCCDAQEPAQKSWATTIPHAHHVLHKLDTHPNTPYKMWRKNIHYNLFPHFDAI